MSGFGSGVPEGTHGHHNSRLANTADPRIDSDRDHRAAPGNTTGLQSSGLQSSGFESSGIQSSGLESSRHTTGIHEPAHHGVGTQEGAYDTGVNRGISGPASKTDGPHSSNLLNKADPRVDSDRDASKNLGLNPQRDATTDTVGGTQRTTGTTHGDTLGSSTHGRTTHGDTFGTTTHGTTGNTLGSTTHGTTGNTLGSTTHGRTTGAPEGTHGPHSSRAANAADPRVDSDRDHRAAHGKTTGTTGLGSSNVSNTRSSGPAPNTAGPHKSDLLNKLDPRVDSDLDGSKTVGGDKTHSH